MHDFSDDRKRHSLHAGWWGRDQHEKRPPIPILSAATLCSVGLKWMMYISFRKKPSSNFD